MKAVGSLSRRSNVNAAASPTHDVFKGFLSGHAFSTTKGYRGTKMDTMWVRHIFDAFENDDVELFNIALESILADITLTVSGGEYRSAFNIGDYGFYVTSQFTAQTGILINAERENITGDKFLSAPQWEEVDKVLAVMGSFSTAKFDHSARGDSFLNLSFRKFAFDVATRILQLGTIDPLVENEDKDDAMSVLIKQYTLLGQNLRVLEMDKIKASEEVVVSSVSDEIKAREQRLMSQLQALARYNEAFIGNMRARQILIDTDSKVKKFNELRGKPCPPSMLWNIQQLEKTNEYIKKCEDLRCFIQDAIAHQNHVTATYVSLATIVHHRHKTLEKRALQAAKALAKLQAGTTEKEEALEDEVEEDGVGDLGDSAKDRSSKIKARQKVRKAREKKAAQQTAAVAAQAAEQAALQSELEAEEAANKHHVHIHDDDARLHGLYKTKTASESKKEIYARAGVKMGTADDYSPVLGVLRQSENELILYR